MRRRMFFFTLLITVIEFIAISFVYTLFIGNNLQNKTQEQLAATCATVEAATRSLSDAELIPVLREAARAGGYRATLIGYDGTVKYDSETTQKLENHSNRPEVIDALSRGTGTAVRYSDTLKCDVMYVAIRMEDGRNILRLSECLSTVWGNLGYLTNGVVWIGLGLLALCGVAAWLAAGGINRPVREMTNVSQTIANGRYDLRIRSRISARDELGKLSRAFNTMADRLESTIGDLNQENEKLSAVLEAMSDGIMAVNAQMRVMLVNERFKQLLDIKTDPVNRHVLETTRMERLETLIKHVLDTGRP
ncbi:MAG: HAMP domain-containing protein, partial [Bacillota bacterium]